MKPQWFIETTIFEKESQALVDEIVKQGMSYKTAEGAEERWGSPSYLNLFNAHECVVYRGSLEFGAQVQREAPWIPGVYRNMDAFDCTNYYPHFGSNLVNEEYIMLPWGELRRRRDWLFKKVGSSDAVFIRPNRGNKIFTGKVVHKEDWDKDLDLLGFYEVPDDELCVVAYPQNLGSEFRWVIVDGKVVSGCKYKTVSHPEIAEFTPIKEFIQRIVDRAEFNPERVWIMDTCHTKEGHKHQVLEVGCFSCSGLYTCPVEPIVREVSRVALEEWKEYNE